MELKTELKSMRIRFLVLLISLLMFPWLQLKAEYRVFLLKISKKNPPTSTAENQGNTNTETQDRQIASTLDPIQYQGYFPLELNETITYSETWKCPGRTDGFKPLCPNPKKTGPSSNLSPDQTPTSQTP